MKERKDLSGYLKEPPNEATQDSKGGAVMERISDERLQKLTTSCKYETQQIAIELQAARETIKLLSQPISELELVWAMETAPKVEKMSERCNRILQRRLNAPAGAAGGGNDAIQG